jgi:hypothetical protein
VQILSRPFLLDAVQAQPAWPTPWPAHAVILYLLRRAQPRYIAQANAYIATHPVTVLHAQVARALLQLARERLLERFGDAPSRAITGRFTICSWWRRIP